jgi:hypothetical protein
LRTTCETLATTRSVEMRGEGKGVQKEANREVVGGRVIRGGAWEWECDAMRLRLRWIRIVSDQMHLPEVSVDLDEDGEAVEIGLKDFMWFLFFGMPGDKLRAVCDELR